jgi:ribosomal protein L16 Arg81 hydroxylase
MQDSINSSAQSKSELPRAWKDWIVENKRLNVPDRTLIETMIEKGIDTQVAIKAVKGIQADGIINNINHNNNNRQIVTAELQTLRKLESLITIQCQLSQLSSQAGTIERRNKITKEEFLEKYYSTNTPLILTDMMSDWQAIEQWCPEFLKSKYGSAEVEVQVDRNADSNYEINTQKHKKIVFFNEYIDRVVGSGATNDYYMVANNQTLEREEFKSLLDDIVMPEFLNSQDTKQKVFFWFGPSGTITPLHHDPMNLIMAHIYGRKRWRLIDPKYTPLLYNHIGVFSKVDLEKPDYDRYPLFKEVPVIETILEAGEIIFVPVGWWHQVKGLDISIALSFTNFIFPNKYNFHNPNIKDWESENRKNDRPNNNTIDFSEKKNMTTTILQP